MTIPMSLANGSASYQRVHSRLERLVQICSSVDAHTRTRARAHIPTTVHIQHNDVDTGRAWGAMLGECESHLMAALADHDHSEGSSSSSKSIKNNNDDKMSMKSGSNHEDGGGEAEAARALRSLLVQAYRHLNRHTASSGNDSGSDSGNDNNNDNDDDTVGFLDARLGGDTTETLFDDLLCSHDTQTSVSSSSTSSSSLSSSSLLLPGISLYELRMWQLCAAAIRSLAPPPHAHTHTPSLAISPMSANGSTQAQSQTAFQQLYMGTFTDCFGEELNQIREVGV